MGVAGTSASNYAVSTGAIYYVSPGYLTVNVFDPTTFTQGLPPDQGVLGPFLWGKTFNNSSGGGAAVWRFDTSSGTIVYIPVGDYGEGAFLSNQIVQDSSGNVWAIQQATNTLLKISQDPPVVAATYPIPNSAKASIAYDPTNNALILLSNQGPTTTIARFLIGTSTFTADATIGNSDPNEYFDNVYVEGGFIFAASQVTSGTIGVYIYKINLTTLAVIGSPVHIIPSGSPFVAYVNYFGVAYLANGGTPKLFVSIYADPATSGTVYRIDVTNMTLDTSFAITGSSALLNSMAFNPSNSSLWVADELTTPAKIYELMNVTGSFTLANTFTIDTVPGTVSNGIVWDSVNSQFWVSCSNGDNTPTVGEDSISSVSTTGSVTNQTTFASSMTALPPGNVGQVLTSGGQGAPPTWATSSGGFSDNAAAQRTLKNDYLRRNEQAASGQINVQSIANSLPAVTDGRYGAAGMGVCLIGDKYFYVGTFGNDHGGLYGVDLFVPQGVTNGSPLTDYGDAPVDLIGIRGAASGTYTSQTDYIFGAFPNALFVELGQLSGTPPNMRYVQLYNTSVPSAPVRACFIGGGGGDSNYSQGASNSYPLFAWSAVNGHIYIVDANGVAHDAFTTGDTPGAMFLDDAGYLWVAYTTANSINKFSINFTSYTLSHLASYPGSLPQLDLISDGRYARGIANNNGVPVLSAWDLQTGSAGPTFNLNSQFPGLKFTYPVDGFFNSSNNYVWLADRSSTTPLIAVDATTLALKQSVSIPSLPLSGQLPNTWSGVRRIIGDNTYIYVSDAANGSPYVCIVDQSTGAVVGQLTVGSGARARDQVLDGAGNIYVVARTNGSVMSSTIQKFSIASVIAAYPSVYSTPSATSPARGYHVVGYDPTTPAIYGGTYGSTDGAEHLVALNPSTLAELNHQDYPPIANTWDVNSVTNNGGLIQITTSATNTLSTGNTVAIGGVLGVPANGTWTVTVIDTSNFTLDGSTFSGSYLTDGEVFQNSYGFSYFFGILGAFGSVWCSTATGSVLRINPATFPAGGSITSIGTSATKSQELFADTTNNTILVSDFGGTAASRVSASTNLEVSYFTQYLPSGSVAFIGGNAIWVVSRVFSESAWYRYTSTPVGSETLINTVTQVPEAGVSARLGWDGVSIYAVLQAPSPG
jgi:hypothetical protein